jgi:hypothetical protein
MATNKASKDTDGGVEAPQEAPDAKARAADISGAEAVTSAPAAERVVLTAEPKRSADKSSSPGGEAFPEDPPVRTTRPDVPIVDSLATGAGQHVPPDPDVYQWDGRLRELQGTDD